MFTTLERNSLLKFCWEVSKSGEKLFTINNWENSSHAKIEKNIDVVAIMFGETISDEKEEEQIWHL